MNRCRTLTFVSLALVLLVASAALADRAVRPIPTSAGLDFQISGDHGALTLKVATPDGAVVQRGFRAGEPVSFSLFDAKGSRMADGEYRWEIVAAPRSAATRGADGGAGKPVAGGWTESGAFIVANGAIAPGEAVEPARPRPAEKVQDPGNKDQVIPDDLIVQGSACVGFDCVNNENFGFDTIRLKENNLRIKFEDTSVGTFPTNDWQLTANDSASGGSSKFSIEDITGSKVPFTIRAGAATNSIFVDSTGRLGLRTSTPVLDLHINTSNTPAIRLEQNNSGGFTAQTWDIGANEANFFVRDVTGGSRLSFRIRPGAPTSSIDIAANGEVGIGTGSPEAKLHVFDAIGAAGTAQAIFTNNGDVRVNYVNNGASPSTWGTNNIAGDFKINKAGTGVQAFTLTGAGQLTVVSLVQSSDRNAKQDITAVAADDVLAKVAALPISTWRFSADDSRVRHLGPMAQDFAAAFGLGPDDRHIAPLDAAGVSLAAIQALNQRLQQKDAEISRLSERLARLEAALAKLAGSPAP